MTDGNCYHSNTRDRPNWASPIIGVITLIATVTTFCIFLLILRRGTPQLWPYATTVLHRSQFAITPTEEPNSLPMPLFEHLKPLKWHLNIKGSKSSFYTPSINHETIYIKSLKHSFTITHYPEWTSELQTSHMYSQSTSLPLGNSKTIYTGGIDKPPYNPEYLKYTDEKGEPLYSPDVLIFSDEPSGRASKSTWIEKSSSQSKAGSPIQQGPNMCTARVFHHLCKTKNGNILVSGGISESHQSILGYFSKVSPVRTVEEFQPTANKFEELGEMQTPRYQHAVCQLPNGNFLIVSGRTDRKNSDSGEDLTATVEIFSPKSKSSCIVGQLHRAMIEPILISLKDGSIAIIDSQSLRPERYKRKAYVEIYNRNQEPVQKLPHLPSVPELIHNLIYWKQ